MYSDFKIAIPITRAYKNDNGEMFVEGVASSDTIDSYDTIFNKNCQQGFAFQIEKGIEDKEPVELEAEHLGDVEPMNCLGPVVSAQVTDNNQLMIVARMDSDNPKAVYYFKKMTVPDPITQKTKQYGLSINGAALRSHYEYRQDLAKNVRVFDEVKLKRIGIVRKPSNPDTWVEKLLRSVNWEEVQTQERNIMETQDNQDQVQRVELYDSMQVLQAMQALLGSMSTVEYWIESEKYEQFEESEDETQDIQTGRQALALMRQAFEKMQVMLSSEAQLESEKQMDNNTERAADTTNSTASMKEDLSDKVETLRSEEVKTEVETPEVKEEVAVETPVEPAAEVVTEPAAQPVPETVAVPEEVNRAEKTELNKEQLSSLVDSISSVFGEKFDEVVRKMEEVTKSFEEVTRKLDETEKANQELVQRLAKVEGQPASAPGGQLLEEVTRSQDPNSTKREENIQRAKQEKNSAELIKFQIFGNKYIGNNEFTV